MGITFGKPHMNTLNKLYEMANKHNCTISFGVDNIYEEAFDWELFAQVNNINDSEVMQDLYDNLRLLHSATYGAKYWFELYDGNTKKYHTFVYYDYTSYCNYDEPWDCSNKALRALENYSDYSHYLECRCEDTKLMGWEGLDTSEAYRCYRSGMCLKFFGDLVCDYLREERIKEVY